MEAPAVEVQFDVNASIQKHLGMLKPWFPKRAFICVGDYASRILLKGSAVENAGDSLPLFVDKSSKNLKKWSQKPLDEQAVLGLDADVDTHFWYDALPSVSEEEFMTKLKNTSVNKVHETIIASSTWDGFSSALLSVLVGQAKPWNTNCVALAVLPSGVQPADAQFNAYSCLGMCASKDFAPMLLLDRDVLEGYVGVDRKGSVIHGNAVLDYVLEIILTKDGFVEEMRDLLKPFDSRMCAVLAITGASFRIYGSLENIFAASLVKPLSEFDLPSTSLVYVLIRMSQTLKDKLPRGTIELAVAGWFEERSDLRSIVVTEPIYVEDALDRIDIVMVVSGYDTSKLFGAMEKAANPIKNHAVENEFLKKEDWQALVKSLAYR